MWYVIWSHLLCLGLGIVTLFFLFFFDFICKCNYKQVARVARPKDPCGQTLMTTAAEALVLLVIFLSFGSWFKAYLEFFLGSAIWRTLMSSIFRFNVSKQFGFFNPKYIKEKKSKVNLSIINGEMSELAPSLANWSFNLLSLFPFLPNPSHFHSIAATAASPLVYALSNVHLFFQLDNLVCFIVIFSALIKCW